MSFFSFLFGSKAERLASRLVEPDIPSARAGALLKKLAALPDTQDRSDALRAVALGRGWIAQHAVELLPPAALCDVAENGSNDDAAEAAIDRLKRLPASDAIIESLCRIIRRFLRENQSPSYSTSVSGHAVHAIRYLDPEMKHPKFVAAIVDVLCNAGWSAEYDSPSNWVCGQLIWMKDQPTLDTAVIGELQRRAMELPLTYDRVGGGWLGVNRFVAFLEKLKERSDRAGAALAEIEADLTQRRKSAVPEVLKRALTSSSYEEVAAMASELQALARARVSEARSALADFKSRPARLLPRDVYRNVDRYDPLDGGTFTYSELSGTETVSTAELGQQRAT